MHSGTIHRRRGSPMALGNGNFQENEGTAFIMPRSGTAGKRLAESYFFYLKMGAHLYPKGRGVSILRLWSYAITAFGAE